MNTFAKFMGKILLALLICDATCLVLERPAAQIDTIFKYNRAERLLKLFTISEERLYSFDSATANNILDTVVAFGDNNGDKRLAWYARYYKLIYNGRKFRDVQKEIVYMNGMKDWVDKCPVEVIRAVYKHSLGHLMYLDNKYAEAFNLMLQAQRFFQEMGYENVPEIAHYQYELANCYYNFGNYQTAAYYAKLSEKYPTGFTREEISRTNTEALAYGAVKDYMSAKKIFLQDLQIANNSGDSVWVGIISGNYGRILMTEGNYAQAAPYLLKDCNLNNGVLNADAAEAATGVAECYLKTGRVAEAKPYFQLGRWLIAQKKTADEQNTVFYKPYYKYIASYYAQTGDIRMASIEEDSLVSFTDSISLFSSSSLLSAAEKRVETENYLTGIAAADESQKNALVLRNIIVAAIALIAILLLILIFIRYRVTVQHHSLLHAEKQAVEEKLHTAESELGAYIKNITEKNELAMRANAELQSLQNTAGNAAVSEKLEALSAIFKFTILTDEDWAKFRELFNVVHPGFFANLTTRLPLLTPTETRLFSLMKLKLSNKEIAAMTAVTTESVTKTKQRLRRKLEERNVADGLDELVAQF